MTLELRSTWVVLGSLAGALLAAAGCPGTSANSCQEDSECFEGEVCYDTRCIDREDLPESVGDASDSSSDADGGIDDARDPDGDGDDAADGGGDAGGDGDVRECDDPSVTWYVDEDNDDYGDEEAGQRSCSEEKLPDGTEAGEDDGFALRSGDCNDDSARVHPDMREICGDDFENNDCSEETKCRVVVGRGEDVSVHVTDAVMVPDRGYLVVGARGDDFDSDGSDEIRAFASLYDFQLRRTATHRFEPFGEGPIHYATAVRLLPGTSPRRVAVTLYAGGGSRDRRAVVHSFDDERQDRLFTDRPRRMEPDNGLPYVDISGVSSNTLVATVDAGGGRARVELIDLSDGSTVQRIVDADTVGHPRVVSVEERFRVGFDYRGSNALDLPADGSFGSRGAAIPGRPGSSGAVSDALEFSDGGLLPPSEELSATLAGWTEGDTNSGTDFHYLLAGNDALFVGAGSVSFGDDPEASTTEVAFGKASSREVAVGSARRRPQALVAGSGGLEWPQADAESTVDESGVVGRAYEIRDESLQMTTEPAVFFDPSESNDRLGVAATAVKTSDRSTGVVFGSAVPLAPWKKDELADWSYLSRRHLDELPQVDEMR